MDIKRILLFSLPIIVVVGGVIIIRRRLPSLEVLNADWDNNKATIKYGNNEKEVGLVAGKMGAGMTYSKRYTLDFYPEGRKTRLDIKDEDGVVVKQTTIDYSAKLIY